MFLRESMDRAKKAGVTGEDLEAYVKTHNIPAKIKIWEWRDLLEAVTKAKELK